jgi:hypothetical protein
MGRRGGWYAPSNRRARLVYPGFNHHRGAICGSSTPRKPNIEIVHPPSSITYHPFKHVELSRLEIRSADVATYLSGYYLHTLGTRHAHAHTESGTDTPLSEQIRSGSVPHFQGRVGSVSLRCYLKYLVMKIYDCLGQSSPVSEGSRSGSPRPPCSSLALPWILWGGTLWGVDIRRGCRRHPRIPFPPF